MPYIPSDYADLQKHFIGQPQLQADETANDSDKALTVPAGKEWEVLSVWVEFSTTATAGLRQLAVRFQDDAADVIGEIPAGITQTISLSQNYLFAPNLPDLTALRAGLLLTPIPRMILPAGFSVRVLDTAAVDAAADDMIVQAMVAERTPV